jgi:hypothetical protein
LYYSQRKILAAERRQYFRLNDRIRDGVGQRAFEAVAHLDADLALVGRDDEQDAVVLFGLSDSPVAAQLVAEIFDRVALQ